MELSKLASKPQLLEIKVDDEDTITKYGEAVSFWMYDRQDIATFVKMSKIDSTDFEATTELVKELIRSKDGKPALNDERSLPMDIQLKVINKVVEQLGKLTNELLPKTTET